MPVDGWGGGRGAPDARASRKRSSALANTLANTCAHPGPVSYELGPGPALLGSVGGMYWGNSAGRGCPGPADPILPALRGGAAGSGTGPLRAQLRRASGRAGGAISAAPGAGWQASGAAPAGLDLCSYVFRHD